MIANPAIFRMEVRMKSLLRNVLFSLIALCWGIHATGAAEPYSITVRAHTGEIFPVQPVKPVFRPCNASKDAYTLVEVKPEARLTEKAGQAIELAPQWIRDDLTDNFMQMDETYQDLYADMILNPSDPKFTDEMAFSVAEVAPEILQDADFIPGLLEENIAYIYAHDQYLDYVRIVDVGGPGDADYYSTTFYKVEESGVITEYQLDRDVYYWFIVHPKIEDEMVDYIDPTQPNDQHAAPPDGVFWRDWLFTYTEPIPGTDDMYPILRDQFDGVNVLWKSTGGIDNGAIGVVNQWILNVMDFTSGAERPHQPVRIYKLHVGRCGEYQDITSAAARACLIPCLNTEAIGEDHVWNEFWDRRWIHWEPVNVYVDDPLVYENGWGKKFSGVVDVYGDGFIWDVIRRYSEGYCHVNVRVEDANHDPIDGAKVVFKRAGYPGIWAFTGSDGLVDTDYGDEVKLTARVLCSLGKYPESSFHEITASTENGSDYQWTATLPASLPQIAATPAATPRVSDGYRFLIDYDVPAEVVRGAYQFDGNHHFSRRVETGNIDFFIVDQKNLALYESAEPFEAYNIQWHSSENSNLEFYFPYPDTWTVIFSAERKQVCNQILQASVRLQKVDQETVTDLDRTQASLILFPGETYRVTVDIPEALGVTLNMPAEMFSPGDDCFLKATLTNPGEPMQDIPLFIILDVLGNYYFYPSWTETVEWQSMDVPQGATELSIIPQFTWPDGVGSAQGLVFYGGMTDAAFSSVLGNIGQWTFGWQE